MAMIDLPQDRFRYFKNAEEYLGFLIYEVKETVLHEYEWQYEFVCFNRSDDAVSAWAHTREELKEWIQHFHSTPENRDYHFKMGTLQDWEANLDPEVYQQELEAHLAQVH